MAAILLLAAILFTPAAGTAVQYRYPFQNPALPEKQRIDNVLSLLTLQEKIDLLGKNLNVPRLGIYGSGKIDSIPGSSGQVEGLHGLAMGGVNHWERKSPGAAGPYGNTSVIPTTQFPQAVGLAETWDPELVREIAAEEGYEARYIFQSYDRGGLIVRAPNADLARDPRWGRSEESYGEDPFLTGTMAIAFVRGLQGNDLRYWQTASLVKHFLANSNEDGRQGSSSNFDAHLLHEYYAASFRMAIEQGHADAFMTAYNAVNGIPMAASPLLRGLVMRQWGFNGMIDTDRGALTDMVTRHHYYPDLATAAAGAIHAGVNHFLDAYRQPVEDALARNLITEADLDRNLRGVLRVMIRLGFLDPPGLDPWTTIRGGNVPVPWDQPATKQLALRAAQESIVLLRNSSHLLPLRRSSVHSIAVIGALANVVRSDGYGGTPPFAVTPLEGIQNAAGPGVQVRYGGDLSTAVPLARKSDVAIVVMGNLPLCHKATSPPPCPQITEGQEGVDRQQITLDAQQQELIRAVYNANRHTILVLVSGFPYAIDWSADHIPAILHMTHSGEEEGTALAQVLFGEANPGGHLVVTWPRSLKELPPMMDYNIRDGRTYMYSRGRPLYPFGYGLSYTTFHYSNLQVDSHSADGLVNVAFQIRNVGAVPGDEVVQMYIRHLNSAVTRPREELEGFDRVSLLPGEEKAVHFRLSPRSLVYWNRQSNRWSARNDNLRVMIGSSSADIELSSTLAGLRGVVHYRSATRLECPALFVPVE